MEGKEDLITFLPDDAQWKGELNAFRQLSVFERPAFQKVYRITEGIKDKKSNLNIRLYTATGYAPVTELKFYYYKQFENLKRIEATWHEKNLLFATTRKVTLEFDDISGMPVLSSYATEGSQKMIFTDSVHFSILSTISN